MRDCFDRGCNGCDDCTDYGDNPPMPQTSKEKQEAFRARNAMLGLTEVRGIFLPPELHAATKRLALELLAKDAAQKLKAKPKDAK